MFHRGSMHMRWFSTTIGLYRYPHFRQQPKKSDKKVHRCPRVCVVSFTILLFKGVSIFAAMGKPSPQTDFYFLPHVKSLKVQNQAIRIILDSVFMPRDQIGPFQGVRIADFSQKQATHDCKPSVEWHTLLTHLAAQP